MGSKFSVLLMSVSLGVPPLQHFIFLGVAVIAWIIPDVPEAVQQEIKKEKLLALEATLKAKGGGGGAEGGNEVSAV